MPGAYSRTELLLGKDGMARLRGARVAVFGLGGVGGHACEALARSGIGALDLIDADRVSLTNLNRQIIATGKTVGQLKTEAMRDRLAEIDPDIRLVVWPVFVRPDNICDFPFEEYDYVLDAVDTVSAKLAIITRAAETCTPVISAMGAGNKLDPSRFRVSDISGTRVCPLARVMRRELRKRGIEKLKVVWSDEEPVCRGDEDLAEDAEQPAEGRRSVPGSTAFVPAAAGLIMAGAVIRDLAGA